jgi:SpoVK/Ycf46/Vps4 family AAA+-type ATPase
MMTAMDVGRISPALDRSRRVELWLEMKLPDAEARAQILSDHLKTLPEELRQPDAPQLVAATEGFTGADLKRLVEDGIAIYVYDKARGADLKPTGDYFMCAVEVVKENKQPYETAQAQALLQPKSPKAGFMRTFYTSHVFKAGGQDE